VSTLLSIGSSPRGRLRRRHGHHPLDGRRSFRARRRELLHALRLRIPGPAEHGRMGDLRSGQRVRQSARVHRAGERADSSGRTRSVWQRLSAGYLPGHAVPQRRASHRRPRAARSYCRAAAEQAEPAAHVERGRARPLRRGQRNGSRRLRASWAGSTRRTRKNSAASAFSPGAWWSAACASSNC